LETRLQFERQCRARGFSTVAGVDEAGRGPLAGPVVAACVLLPAEVDGLEAVHDSKKIPPRQRETLFQVLHDRALGIGVGVVDAPTIDRINILQATFLAMQQAVARMPHPPDFLLSDGNRKPAWAPAACETLVQGDARSLSIAAASIIAKVTRDRLMDEYDQIHPGWGFSRHKGYGTEAHLAAIRAQGLSPIHRRSFLPIAQMDFSFIRA
jgi:ribonuclease HII